MSKGSDDTTKSIFKLDEEGNKYYPYRKKSIYLIDNKKLEESLEALHTSYNLRMMPIAIVGCVIISRNFNSMSLVYALLLIALIIIHYQFSFKKQVYEVLQNETALVDPPTLSSKKIRRARIEGLARKFSWKIIALGIVLGYPCSAMFGWFLLYENPSFLEYIFLLIAGLIMVFTSVFYTFIGIRKIIISLKDL